MAHDPVPTPREDNPVDGDSFGSHTPAWRGVGRSPARSQKAKLADALGWSPETLDTAIAGLVADEKAIRMRNKVLTPYLAAAEAHYRQEGKRLLRAIEDARR